MLVAGRRSFQASLARRTPPPRGERGPIDVRPPSRSQTVEPLSWRMTTCRRSSTLTFRFPQRAGAGIHGSFRPNPERLADVAISIGKARRWESVRRMRYRPLGSTGIQVSEIAFGAGPVSGLMTGDSFRQQCDVVAAALDVGINWFDTAATYGDGQSETSLGRVLRRLAPTQPLHLATKVRLMPDELDHIPRVIRASVETSLARLDAEQLTLLQLHNSVTKQRGDEPTSLSVADVLGPGGVLETFEQLRAEGVVLHLGLTGIGDPESLRALFASGKFDTLQTPYNLLNTTGVHPPRPQFVETNYGGIINDCAARGMGVFAIRVLAGGALVGQAPSEHTRKTRFFPLDLFERDTRRAARIQAQLPPGARLADLAVQFALAQDAISAAIIGLGDVTQVQAAARLMEQAPLAPALLAELQTLAASADAEPNT